MNFFANLSIKSKLIYILLVVSLGCIIVIAIAGLSTGKQALNDQVYEQLTSVRATKASQIEQYFQGLDNQLKTLAHDKMIVGAMREFQAAYSRFDEETISDQMLDSLKRYYSEEFLPKLAQNIQGEPNLEHYLPQNSTSQYLQYQYVANNPNPVGEKQQLDQASDRSYYSGVHKYYHPPLRKVAKNFGYYDLFLISLEKGDVVYTVAKETDFATSLRKGPYSASNLSRLYKKIYRDQDDGAIFSEDFNLYRPSLGIAEAFIGTTIYDDNHPIGILAIQIPVGAINSITSGHGKWSDEGLGETGEVYLAGADKLMRSNARSLEEGKDCYRSSSVSGEAPDPISERICRQRSSVLMQSVDNEAVNNALIGKTGIACTKSYDRETMLSSFSPLNIPNFDWVIVAQIAAQEANQPIYSFQKYLTLTTVLLGCLVTFLAMYISSIFTRPIKRLMDGIHRLRQGDLDTKIDLPRNDEFGQLATTLNQTMDLVKQQKEKLHQSHNKHAQLLRNFLPEAIAKRIESGEKEIADSIPNVTVLFASLNGSTAYVDSMEPSEAVKELNQLISTFDDAAEQHGVEKISTVGDTYIAACGLTVARLDHAKRTVAFAKDMMDIVERYNKHSHSHLGLRIGIHSGPVIGGIIGTTNYVYDIWGESVNVASRIRYEAPLNSILVTETVYERLANKDGFEQQSAIKTKAMGSIKIWIWRQQGMATDEQENSLADDETLIMESPIASTESSGREGSHND
ncbi:MAG: adenylate/guanylate cyclase domain-containing protein [bacterium]